MHSRSTVEHLCQHRGPLAVTCICCLSEVGASLIGTAWVQSTVQNKLEGVTKGFLVYLRIAGIGYRATQQGQTLTFKLGYSHDIVYTLPDSMRALLPEPTLLGLYGVDKNQVLLPAAISQIGRCHNGFKIPEIIATPGA